MAFRYNTSHVGNYVLQSCVDTETGRVIYETRTPLRGRSQGLTQTERQLAEWLIKATIGAIAFLFKGIGRLFGVRSY